MTDPAIQRRVLVVEDEHGLRELVTDYLRGQGFVVDEAEHGAAALEVARSRPPDVLVLDLNMPEMDGAAVLAELNEHPVLKSVPVVLVSAASELSDIASRFEVRATLAKPFDLDVLRAVIEQLLAHPEPPPHTPTIPADS